MPAGLDLNHLINIVLHHLEVPATFIPGSLLLGGVAWWLAPRRGWARLPAALAGCGLALVLAVTVARPIGQFAAGGLNPLTTLQQCMVGSLSVAQVYEQLNVLMLMPFAFFGALAARRPRLIATSCVLLTGFVELVQSATGGGQCQVRDLVHNSAGGVLGVLLAIVTLRLLARRAGAVTADLGTGAGH